MDSSALVKLVVDEPGSEDVAVLWDGADAVFASRVAHPELRAALAAAHRDGRLDAPALEQARADWDDYRAALRPLALTPQLQDHAGHLTEQHALSGFDAIHLASALAVAEAPLIVATWDHRLLTAAHDTGLRTLPVSL